MFGVVGEKPFKCHICDVRVTRQEHLKRHLLTHIEGRPFKCSACDFTARRKDGVRSHQRSKHQGVVVSIDTIIKIPGVMSGPDGKPVITGEYQEQSIVPGKLSTIPFGPKPNKGKKKKKKRDKNAPPPPPVAMIEGMPLPNADLAAITSMTAILAQQKEIYLQQQGQLMPPGGQVTTTGLPSSTPMYTTPMGTMTPMSNVSSVTNITPMSNTSLGEAQINSSAPIYSTAVNGTHALQQVAMLNGLTHPGIPVTPHQTTTPLLPPVAHLQHKPLDMQVDKEATRSPVMLEAAHKSMLNSMAHKLNRSTPKTTIAGHNSGGNVTSDGLRIPKSEPCMSSPSPQLTHENKSPAAMFNPHMSFALGNHKVNRQLTTPMPMPTAPPIHTPLPTPSSGSNKSANLVANSPSCIVSDNKPLNMPMTADMERLLPQVMQASASFGQRCTTAPTLPVDVRPAHMNHGGAAPSMMPPYYSNWPNLATAAHHSQSSLIHAPNPIHPGGAGVMGQMINSLQEHMHTPQHPFSFTGMPHMSLHSKSHHS